MVNGTCCVQHLLLIALVAGTTMVISTYGIAYGV